MGYKMVIWPVSSLRVANKAQAELYAAIRRDGGTQNMVDRMQTRAELYATIGYHDYEALDASIVATVAAGDAATLGLMPPDPTPPAALYRERDLSQLHLRPETSARRPAGLHLHRPDPRPGLARPGAAIVEAPMATDAELTRFHDPAYLAALSGPRRAQAVTAEDRARYRIGADGNPVYREIYRRPATSAGGVILAARLTADGGVVHCPGGGTHHGRPDRASGFCYLNDPVLGLLTWLDLGLDNIVYLDIDAHHGDGVQDAFHDDPRVFTIIHPRGRPLAVHRRGGRPRRRLGAQFPGAARPQRQRDPLPDAGRRAAADRGPPAAGDPAAGRRRRAARKTRWPGSSLSNNAHRAWSGAHGPRARGWSWSAAAATTRTRSGAAGRGSGQS